MPYFSPNNEPQYQDLICLVLAYTKDKEFLIKASGQTTFTVYDPSQLVRPVALDPPPDLATQSAAAKLI